VAPGDGSHGRSRRDRLVSGFASFASLSHLFADARDVFFSDVVVAGGAAGKRVAGWSVFRWRHCTRGLRMRDDGVGGGGLSRWWVADSVAGWSRR
jgi:hypothetical protein